jgi:hypothetical protein
VKMRRFASVPQRVALQYTSITSNSLSNASFVLCIADIQDFALAALGRTEGLLDYSREYLCNQNSALITPPLPPSTVADSSQACAPTSAPSPTKRGSDGLLLVHQGVDALVGGHGTNGSRKQNA